MAGVVGVGRSDAPSVDEYSVGLSTGIEANLTE
jgi:hypothetical protein